MSTTELYSVIVATYAALVATGTAIFEFIKWRQSRTFLCVTYNAYWKDDVGGYHVAISNRSEHAVYLSFVAISYGKKVSLFKRFEHLSQKSISRINDTFAIERSGHLDGLMLKPGEMYFGDIDENDLKELKSEWSNLNKCLWDGFYIWIEHSQSERAHKTPLRLEEPV